MGIQHTPNHHIAYMDELTPLTQLDEVTKQVAEALDAAMSRAGYTPPDATTFADLVAATTPTAWVLATGQSVPNFDLATPPAANWPKLSYRRDNAKTVRIRGGLKGTFTVTASQTLFTLPVGFRPITYQSIPATVAGNAAAVGMWVHPDGRVQFAAAGTHANLLLNHTFPLD